MTEKIIIRPSKCVPSYGRVAKGSGCTAKGYQGMINPNNVCTDDDNVAFWGVKVPTYMGNVLRDYPDAVGGLNGSFNVPTPFTLYWNFPTNISNDAIIKRVTIHYQIGDVQYKGHSRGKFISNPDNYPARDMYGSNCKCSECIRPYRIYLNFEHKSEKPTAEGQGLRQPRPLAKNDIVYADNEIPKYSSDLIIDSNYTINDLKKSTVKFEMPRNFTQDIAKIVLRQVYLEVEYEDIPPEFAIEELSLSKTSLTNCTDDSTRAKIGIKSENQKLKDTQIKISGTGISKASEINYAVDSANNPIEEKFDTNGQKYLIWYVKDFGDGYSADTAFDLKYKETGTFNIQASIQKYGTNNKKEKSINVTVESCEPDFNFEFLNDKLQSINSSFAPLVNGRYIFSDYDDRKGFFKLTLKKNQALNHTENITIETGDLPLVQSWALSHDPAVRYEFKYNPATTAWESPKTIQCNNYWIITYNGLDITDTITITKKENSYIFTGLKEYYIQENICFYCKASFDTSGQYSITGRYNNYTKTEWSKYKTFNITVKGIILGKEYFKLRLEDGSDVRYNSLMVTEGDDLLDPLVYTTEEIENYINDMVIIGEKKRIPLGETQYIKFEITLDTEKEVTLKNVLTYIDVYRSDSISEDVIVGAGKGVTLLESHNDKICSIDEISSTKKTVVKLAIKSDIEVEDVEFRLKPFNYDRYTDEYGWIPAHAQFKNIPNIKISIEGISDLQYNEDDEKDGFFWLYYNIENLSNTAGKNVRFQLKEPSQFRKIQYTFKDEDSNDIKAPWFNSRNRIITFPELEANSKKYIVAVQYKATKKGIYNFFINTLDDPSDWDDDQYSNSFKHELLVNIDADVRVQTDVSNSLPYVYDLIDFHINVKNFYKDQKEFIFEIYDIGSYEPTTHNHQDYYIEYINCPNGTFEPIYDEHDTNKQYPNAHDGNRVGIWKLTDIKAGDEYDLTLSVRPQDIGNHFFKTIFINNTTKSNTYKDLYNEVKVLERDKQLEFRAYHAVDETGKGCTDCDALTEICDDDFINLGDDIYYVMELKNNSRNDVTNTLHLYARVPESFLTNTILCSSHKYVINQENNLISYSIPKLNGCNKDDSSIKICFKLNPAEIGEFNSLFTLVTRNSPILYKQLKLTVDTEYDEKQLEHQISIYNFEKTNRYYRYEIDSTGSLFKFFNTGDKTYRPIRIENNNVKAVETYRGHNLREIIRDIKKYSKYVDPLFLKEGANGFKDKAYELHPDGLIRRFGLLNSEVFHYSHQFPQTTDLVIKAMKWDIDMWDTKLWASDRYDNGVFDLTIDYAKIPSNFDILNVENPIKNLQNLVDNVKPYGTKAICYYSATVEADIAVNIDEVRTMTNYDIHADIILPEDFDLISSYNRHDNSLAIYHDLMKMELDISFDELHSYIDDRSLSQDKDALKSQVYEVTTSIYGDSLTKQYVDECFDLISDSYTSARGRTIDIIKPYKTPTESPLLDNNSESYLVNRQIINLVNNLTNKQSIGLIIKPYRDASIYVHTDETNTNITDDRPAIDTDSIKCVFYRDDINNFNGFQLIVDGEVQQQRSFYNEIKTISIEVQTTIQESNTILHFWGSINEEDYLHIGYAIINDIKEPTITLYNDGNDIECTRYEVKEDVPISFQISNDTTIISKEYDEIKGIEKRNKWNYLNRIGKGHNQYAYFENSIDIDPECQSRKINIPKIMLKYDNFDLSNYDEITDIKFRLQAQSNKRDFADDININLYKNGNAYLPNDKIAEQIHYPTYAGNVNQEFFTTVILEQPNMTICSDCLKTSLNYHTNCIYCGSPRVKHYKEPQSATICHNCGWIINGWHEYCTHCLSYNVTKTQIDFNKTYCKTCETMSNDYYKRCPACFSYDIQHLTNTSNKYHILDEDTQNIEPLVIQGDPTQINGNDNKNKRINICNLEIPLNYGTEQLGELNYLTLYAKGHNNNPGTYFYCEACGKAELGNYDTCPHCTSNLVHNYKADSPVMEIYPQINGNLYSPKSINLTDNFKAKIPLYDKDDAECYTKLNILDSFKLLFYIESKAYDKITNDILELPVDDEQKGKLLDILLLDLSIDNFYFDYSYIDENEWVGLENLQGVNHTFIHYSTPIGNSQTDTIRFKDFDIENGEYLDAELYISGVIKKTTNGYSTQPKINIDINNNETTYNHQSIISGTLFNYKLNLNNLIGDYIKDISVRVDFKNITSDINITDVYIITKKRQYENIIHDNVNEIGSKIVKENNYYLIESLNNNLWGINNEAPYYLSGNQLDTGLIAYFDFGKLELEEYLRVYDIEMLVYYKTRTGQIVTESIMPENDKAKQAIIESQERLINEGKVTNNWTLNEDNVEQILTGQIIQKDGEILGSIDYPKLNLNNLEHEVTNINEDDDLVNDIPLYYKLAQSFVAQSSSISTMSFGYFGKRGYPNNLIKAYLCKDDDGEPGAIIQKSIIQVNGTNVINIEFNVYDLIIGEQYWVVLEDTSADKNNYHRFYYNNNTTLTVTDDDGNTKDLKLQLLHYAEKTFTRDPNSVLSFSIDSIDSLNSYWKLPVTWMIDMYSGRYYKIRHIFYRYNTNDESNVTFSDFNMKSGYYYTSY